MSGEVKLSPINNQNSTTTKKVVRAQRVSKPLGLNPAQAQRAVNQLNNSGNKGVVNKQAGANQPQPVIIKPPAASLLTKKERKQLLRKELNIVKVSDKTGVIRNVWEVPECTKHYISARLYPFDTMAGACLPTDTMTFPSAKLRTMASGTFRLGTGNIGYIAFLPAWGSDSANIITTTNTSVGTGATALSAFTNLVSFSFPQLPYPSASFGANLLGRFVAGGIRIQYAGTLMNQNGVAFSYCDPDHSSVTNTLTLNQFGNYDTCRRVMITGQVQMGEDNWITCLDNGPAVRSELDFAAASSVQATPYMVIAVQGVAGDLFEFEVVQHCEIEGTIVPNMTESHADDQDFEVIDSVVKANYATGPPQPKEEKGIIAQIGEAMASGIPKIAQLVSGGLTSVPGIVKGILSLMPMGGGHMRPDYSLDGPTRSSTGWPMLEKTALSYDVVTFRQARIKDEMGRGSNLRRDPRKEWIESLVDNCIQRGIAPEQLVLALFPEVEAPKRRSLPTSVHPLDPSGKFSRDF